ncbi:MAG TPA: lysophospholipid acyltransferase family protein [Longimicrobiales bacterium]|nr:lysophospholipid acyltransferase family protein [Longimicrobiales bacterium]
MLRSLWLVLNALVSTPPLSLAIIVASVLRLDEGIYDRIPRIWCRWLLWAAGVDVEVQGLTNIDPDRPQIIASNHVSWFDVGALAVHLPKRYRFIAKRELASVPLWGRAWQAAGHIAIDRSDTQSAVATLDEVSRTLHRDHSAIVIFPEGTRSPTGNLQPFKKGAFMLALRSGVEIVPTAVLGTHDILPRNGWRVRPGRIIVRFGPPVNTADYSESTRDELVARVRTEIQALLDAPAPEN